MADTDSEIHIPTLERCIAALRGSGEFKREWVRFFHEREGKLLERWTYTTHPVDLLEALRPKPRELEKTEAEKLVDEWDGDPNSTPYHERRDYLSLAQFILDRVNADKVAEAFPAEPIDIGLSETPQYVYGPWIEWQGGERPVPGDWMVQLRLDNHNSCGSVTAADHMQWDHQGRGDITRYRVSFEVGQWYDWHGGECPLEADAVVEMKLRDGRDFGPYEANAVTWRHGVGNGCGDIIRFKVVGNGETA